jgi:superfamily II DNA or RNA helicase
MGFADLWDWALATEGRTNAPATTPAPDPVIPRVEPAKPQPRALRPYQADARDKIVDAFKVRNIPRALGVMGTGGGKTVLFSTIAALWQPRRTLILTDQLDLVDQAIRNIRATTGLFADAEQGDRTASMNAGIVVATVQTIGARLGKYPRDHFDLVVCDECDRAVSPQWKKVLGHFDGHAQVLGVTATPNRSDKKDILKYFGEKLFDVGAMELIEKGYLAPISVQTLPLSIDLTEAEDGAKAETEYDADKVAKAIKGIFAEVCQEIKKHAPNRKILVFLPNVESSKDFTAIAIASGINARHIDGTSPNRREIQQAFRDGEFQLLANPCLLGRGYDDPSIDCVINLRATKSLAFYQQVVGRGTRIFCPHGCGGPCQHENRKRDLLILDFLYQFKGMGPIRPAMLAADSPKKAAAMQAVTDATQGKLDLREIMERADRDMRAALLKAFSEAQKAKGSAGAKQYFNAFQWAAKLKFDALIDYMPDTPAEAAPPRRGLITKLTQAGFVPESITCQGHALAIMERVDARREAGLCTFKQMFWLQRQGIKDAELWTQKAAANFLTERWAENDRMRGIVKNRY